MKFSCTLIIFVSLLSYSQEDVKTLEAFNINVGVQMLQPSSLDYSNFKSSVNGNDFFIENSTALNTTSDKLYARQFVNGGLQFRILKEKSLSIFKKFNLNLGGSFAAGQNLTYNFSENYRVQGDSIFITQAGQTEVYTSDTLYRLDTRYYSELKNVGLSTEFCMSTSESKTGFSTGFGLLGSFSIDNQLDLTQDRLFSTALYDENGNAAYVETISVPNAQSPVYGSQLASTYNNSMKLASVYSIMPYIPLKMQAALSEDNFLKDLSVEFFAKVGYEFQFSASNYRSGRLSYLLGFGINYYL